MELSHTLDFWLQFSEKKYIICRVIQQENIFIQDGHLWKHIAQAYNEHP